MNLPLGSQLNCSLVLLMGKWEEGWRSRKVFMDLWGYKEVGGSLQRSGVRYRKGQRGRLRFRLHASYGTYHNDTAPSPQGRKGFVSAHSGSLSSVKAIAGTQGRNRRLVWNLPRPPYATLGFKPTGLCRLGKFSSGCAVSPACALKHTTQLTRRC